MTKAKAIFNRFVKAFISGAISASILIPAFAGNSIDDLTTWGWVVGFSLLAGGLNGILMGVQKWYSWKE